MNHDDAIHTVCAEGLVVRYDCRYVRVERSVVGAPRRNGGAADRTSRTVDSYLATGTVSKVGVSSCCYLYSIELVARFVPQLRSR